MPSIAHSAPARPPGTTTWTSGQHAVPAPPAGRTPPAALVRLPYVAGGLATLLGGIVLAGWAFRLPALTRIADGLPAMVPSTAVGFVLAGAALCLVAPQEPSRGRRAAAAVSAAACAALGLLVLGTYVFAWGTVLRPPLRLAAPWAGVPSIPTATTLVLLGAALLRLSVGPRHRQPVAQTLAAVALCIPVVAVVGYMYGVAALYGAIPGGDGRVGGRMIGMALHSAITASLLAVGVLAARPDRGLVRVFLDEGAAGVVARRLLPAAVLVPLALGWLRFTSERAGIVDARLAASVASVASAVVFVGLIGVLARRLHAADNERAALLAAERAARAEAEEANAAKAQFLTTMSHELRTPLNAIGGYAQLIELGVHGPVSAAQSEALRRIRQSQAHLLGLINQVLNYARLETGSVAYRDEPVPLAAVVREVVALVEPQARQKGLSLDVGPLDEALVARGDDEKVRQILLNLLSNAVKFTDRANPPDDRPGVVRVWCEALPGAPGDPAPAGRAAVRAADTGRGIAPDDLEHVFEPFVQVGRRLTSVDEGVGLGLAISRDLARGMGGDLAAESAPGAGSTFTLTLPRA